MCVWVGEEFRKSPVGRVGMKLSGFVGAITDWVLHGLGLMACALETIAAENM